jgi:hypothetical protein
LVASVDTGARLRDARLELLDLVVKHLEDAADLAAEALELLELESHDREVAEHLQELLIEIFDDCVQKQNGACAWVRFARVPDLAELCKYLFDGRPDHVHVGRGEQLVDGEVAQELVVLARLLQLGLELEIVLELVEEREIVALLNQAQGHVKHLVVLQLLLDVGQAALNR